MDNKTHLSPEYVELRQLHLKKRHVIELHDLTKISYASIYYVLRGQNPTTPKNIGIIEGYIDRVKAENEPIQNPFRLTPAGFIQCYSTNRKLLDPWIMWSSSGGFETKDIVELRDRWIAGELKQIAPYLPNPEFKNENVNLKTE